MPIRFIGYLSILLIFLQTEFHAQNSQNILIKKTGAYTIPFEFVFDPASSYNSYKNITSVNLPAVFNGWNTGASPLAYDDKDKVWKTTVNLDPGEYEYKFFLNNNQWTEDPDNPLNRSSYNNSVAVVKNIDTIYFRNFSTYPGTIIPDSIQTFTLSAKIFTATSRTLGTIKTYYSNDNITFSAISSSYSAITKTVSLTLEKNLLKPGLNYIKFEAQDQQGNSIAKHLFPFGVFNAGFNFIDDMEDENLSYPEYVPSGSADIEYFNINSNSALDTLTFTIKMKKISGYTRLGFQIFNSLSYSFTNEIPSINLQTNDWSYQGLFINLMDPGSPYCDTSRYNKLYLTKNPATKENNIKLNTDSISVNKFIFKIPLSLLNDLTGQYSQTKYYSLYSYLSDNAGNDLKTSANINQPAVYDLCFAKKYRQDILLSNFSSTRIARLDAEGRGIIAILPEQIHPNLKSNAPVITILTRSNLELRTSSKIIEGTVNDLTVSSVDIIRNGQKFNTVSVSNGSFTAYVGLNEGDNKIKVTGKNNQGLTGYSGIIHLNYIIDHNPKAKISVSYSGNDITFDASNSTDPDNDITGYLWTSDDKINPVKLNLTGTNKSLTLQKPAIPGEYYFNLIVTDKTGNKAASKNYFTVSSEGSIIIPDVNSNPQWVKDAIVYEIFVKSFSSKGDIESVTKKIQYFKELGINCLWLMPIMQNQGEISEMGGGYGIIDFYNIAPQYGDFNSYKTLIDSAHNNGIKIILDITQNHVADRHPWVQDTRWYGKYSNYYNYIERRILGNARDLGQYLSDDGIYAHYSNWTLPNLNLSDDDCKDYMIKMFKWWLVENNTDGFRFDVYWGPQNRYGKDAFWRPVRNELKNVKPEIFLLGETDGTGTGSEVNYADGGGACDAAYDWNFYTAAKQIFSTQNVSSLHDKVINYGYYPGNNSYFFRFLENHDEDRIAGLIGFERNKTILALLMTVPGIPMIYMGQEVGWTGRRNLINLDNPSGAALLPYYKRIINARKKFPAFRTRTISKLNSGDGSVYAYIRPYKDENAIVVLNFSGNSKNITLNINESSDLTLSSPLISGKDYYLNDFSNDTYYMIKKDNLSNLQINLSAFEARVMILSDRIIKIQTTIEMNKKDNLPESYFLGQNYPNPFNPVTTIDYSIILSGNVKLVVYDVLGRITKTLVDEYKTPGSYKAYYDSTNASGGVYFYKLISGNYSNIKKMVLIK